jgi:serine/threonine-protein kinase
MDDTLFSNEAIRQGFITFGQAQEALGLVAAAKSGGMTLTISEVLVRKGYLSQAQADAVIEKLKAVTGPTPAVPQLSEDDQKLINEAIRQGLITFMQVQECMAAGKPIAETLVAKKYLTQAQIDAILPKPKIEDLLREAESKETPKTFGPYEILDQIGEGDAGVVYKAKKDGKTVALRVLRDDFAAVDKFKREAKPKVALAHPNLVKYLSFGLIEKKYFAAMEFADGLPVSEILKQKGVMEEATVAKIGAQIAQALAVVHAGGLVHRAVRPSRILIDAAGNARLMELAVERSGPSPFQAPEENRGEADIDAKADLYSLGATLYTMLVGAPPFDGTAPGQLAALQSLEAPDPKKLCPGLSDSMRLAIRRLLSPKKTDRPADIAKLLDKKPVRGTPMPKPKAKSEEVKTAPPKKSSKKNTLILAGSAVGVLALLAVVLIVALSSNTTNSLSVQNPNDPNEPPATGPNAHADVMRRILDQSTKENFSEALKILEKEGAVLPEPDRARLKSRIREEAAAALNAVKRSVNVDLKAGSYDQAAAKLEAFRPKVISIPDVIKELNAQAANVEKEREQNLVHQAEDEHRRVTGRIGTMLDAGEFDRALQICRDSIAKSNNPHLKKLIDDEITTILKRKESFVAKPSEQTPVEPPPADDETAKKLEEAWSAFKKRDWLGAFDAVNEVLSKTPRDPKALGLRARIFAERKDYDKARADAEMALQVDARSPDGLYVMSFMGVSPEKAVEYLTVAISGRREFGPAHLRRAQLLMNMARYPEAVQDTFEAYRFEDAPEFRRECFRIRVEALRRSDQIDQAITESTAWVNEEPANKTPLLVRADLYLKKDRKAEAKGDYEAVLKIDPNDIEAKTRMADLGGVAAKPPDIKPPKPVEPAVKPPPDKKPSAAEKAKAERERKENIRKKLMEHFNGLQERVDLLDDGRYRITMVWDFSEEKHFNDFKSNGTRQKGWYLLKSPRQGDPAVLMPACKIKGDFVARMEYLVDEVHDTEIAAILLRTTNEGDVGNTGTDGVGTQLANTTAFDLKEWKFQLWRIGADERILTDRLNPVLVRHEPKQRQSLLVKRDGITYQTKYGQAPPLTANSEGPDPCWIRTATVACTIKVVRYELQAYLDPEYVNQLFPPAAPSGDGGKAPDAAQSDWAEAGGGNVTKDGAALTIEAVDTSASLVYEKSKFDKSMRVEMKFNVEAVGANFSTGLGLVVNGSNISTEGNLLVEWREDGGSPVLNVLKLEGRSWKILGSAKTITPLKPGLFPMVLAYDGSTLRAELNAVDSVSVPLKVSGSMRYGIWCQNGRIKVNEISGK